MIRLIDLSEDLIEAAVDEIVKTGNLDFSDAIVVYPSQRIGFFLRDRLSRRLRKNYFPPKLLTQDQFLNVLFDANCPGFELIGDLEGALLVFRAVNEVFQGSNFYGGGDRLHFPGFFPWAMQILRALEETMVEGASFEKLNPDIFREFVHYGDYHREYRQFIMELPRLVQVFSRMLRKKRKATRGLVYQTVANLAEMEELRLPDASTAGLRLIFLGFYALNHCEEKLFRHLYAHYDACMILRTDTAALKDPASPFYLHHRILKVLNGDVFVEGDASEKSRWNKLSSKVLLYASSNRETMMAQVYDVLSKVVQSKDSEDELLRIGVVLPDAASLIPFVQGVVSRFEMEQTKVPFNISLGYPFERTPLFQMIDLMLKVKENQKGGQFYSPDYLNLIRHPYVKLSVHEESGADVVRWALHIVEDQLGRHNLLYFSITELESLLGDSLEASSEIDVETGEKIMAAVQYTHKKFLKLGDISFIQSCRWLRDAILAIERNRGGYLFLQEYIASALTALEGIVSFTEENESEFLEADFKSTAKFIRHYLTRTDIHFRGSPLRGIQVMGMLEFRGLSFDEVIVLDAVEGILPQSNRYDPLLPYDIRRVLHIQVYSDWEQLFAYNFFSLIGGSKKSHVFWPEKQGFDRGTRSRFIERIVYEIEKERGIADYPNLVKSRIDFLPETCTLKRAKKNEKMKERIGAMRFSPSSLETYIQCPLRFYFERVLRLVEREEIDAGLDASDFGHIIHDTLNEVYKGKILQMNGLTPETLKSFLREKLQQQFLHKGFKQLSGVGKIRLWVLTEKLTEFVQFDQQRLQTGGIQIIGFEEELELLLKVEGLDHDVMINGRIDRIEKDNGRTRIVDYKTGRDFPVKVNRGHMTLAVEDLRFMQEKSYLDALNTISETYKNFQVLLYMLMYNAVKVKDYEKMDAAYMFLRSPPTFFREVFVQGRKDTAVEPHEKKIIMERFIANLRSIIRDIHHRDAFIANSADDRYCSYCPFRVPCGNL